MREQLCVIREAILLSSADIQGQQVAAPPTENNAELCLISLRNHLNFKLKSILMLENNALYVS